MSTPQYPDPGASSQENSFMEESYFKETQLDIWQHEKKKTMHAVFAIGAVLLGSDLLALLMANALTGASFVYVLIVPAIYAGIGLFAQKKPLAAAILAALLFLAIIAFTIYALGAKSMVSGLLIKAIVIFFVISAFHHAREAERAKRNLELIS